MFKGDEMKKKVVAKPSKKKSEVLVGKVAGKAGNAELSDPVVILLQEAIKIRTERNAKYKGPYNSDVEAYKKHGIVMQNLFPQGVNYLNGVHSYNRFQNLNTIVGKLIRYIANYENGGHEDSMKDIAVYSQMQIELDRIYLENK